MNPADLCKPTSFPHKWIPVSLSEQKKLVTWVYAGNKHLDEPFFEDSVKVIKQTSPEVKETSIDELLKQKTRTDQQILPTAFIFHISRCGSTLIMQMLAQSRKNVIYAEPPLLDDILSSTLRNEQKIAALQAAVAAMGQKRTDDQINLFIKWDSWHLAFYQLIRKAFPMVPVLFLYRQPLEVLKSHRKMRGRHMVPGMLKADVFNIKNIPPYDLDGYSAAVLSQLYQWMISYSSHENTQLINYSALPGKLFRVIESLGLYYSDDELEAMRQRTKTHSKQPLKAPRPDYQFEKEQLERLEGLSLSLSDLFWQLEHLVSSKRSPESSLNDLG
ncbi:hypothetical protein C900_03061 [Fulvivirga imtechensis AK7]|uniref:Sulfotransferase family protein n=1 Tax=Fulvivirga imtechensis AK7 TaxID=1237149 RepID=L8JUZ9_9BACT|nr:sulfotransferase family protein [Fulvivirga imtechensis]ELR71097.1 hypothetical protein C900_03061 [Fulvivirga imtechensis AK7]